MDNTIKNSKIRIKVFLLLVGIIVICVGGFFIWNTNFNTKVEIGMIDKSITKQQIEERKKDKVDKSILAIDMNSSIELETTHSEALLNISNLPENNYDIKVEIYTRDKNLKKIYTSETIKPGYIIRKDKLNDILEKGTHACIATFTSYDEKGIEVMQNNVQMDITIKN